jgi:hypothetical protein
MGEVIDFPIKNKRLEEVKVELEPPDPQAILECAIVELWEKLGGFKLKMSKKEYLLAFLAFSDMCFGNMEVNRFTVDENGMAQAHPKFINEMKGFMYGVRLTTEPPTSNN